MSADSTPEPVPGRPGSPDVWATPPPRPDGHDPSPLPGTEGWDRPPDLVAADPLGPLPSTFGRYRVLKRLGAGGMGTVYLTRDTQLDRLVALKVPKLGKDDAKARERFLREARAAATVHHPNLCPVHDSGEIDGTLFLTMAYVEGHTLTQVLHATQPTERQAAALVRKLALALAEAHAKKVIHRDLKPGNVMLNARGEPVVMDFGLARRGGRIDPSLTQFGTVLGTPAYMAPEQAEGDPDEVGPSCDVYSLGVILYQLLAGEVPFKGDRLAILSQLASREPAPPSARRPGLDPTLEAICLKAMAKRPERRFTAMAEFAAALTEFLKAGSSSSSGETAVIETPGPKRRRRRRRGLVPRWVYLAAAVVVLGGLGNLVLRQGRRSEPKPEPPAPAPLAEPIVQAPPPQPTPRPDDKEKRLKEAEATLAKSLVHLEKQEYLEAIAQSAKAIDLNPDLAGARRTRGLALAAAGKVKEAVADLTAALAKDGNDVLALQTRSGLLVELNDNFAAIEDYNALLRLRPGTGGATWPGSELHEPNGPAGKANALRDFASAVAIDPELARQVPKYAVPRLGWDEQQLQLGLIPAPTLAGEAEWFKGDFNGSASSASWAGPQDLADPGHAAEGGRRERRLRLLPRRAAGREGVRVGPPSQARRQARIRDQPERQRLAEPGDQGGRRADDARAGSRSAPQDQAEPAAPEGQDQGQAQAEGRRNQQDAGGRTGEVSGGVCQRLRRLPAGRAGTRDHGPEPVPDGQGPERRGGHGRVFRGQGPVGGEAAAAGPPHREPEQAVAPLRRSRSGLSPGRRTASSSP
ncbi:MAG: protein kinase [Gemmataceae bacterium]